MPFFILLALFGAGWTQAPAAPAHAAAVSPAAAVPADFVIGSDDVLTVIFWRDKELSGDVIVRPDGKISLPLLNDVQASGLTPEELRQQLTATASKLLEDPSVSVMVKDIRSRKVFVTGQVVKPGPYPLREVTTVLQMIATAGGLLEYANGKSIRIMRRVNGVEASYRFNYKDVIKGKNLPQNIELKPGDTIVVP